jgi:hypothetical protein
MFADTIVQKDPTVPLYCEHSFVTCKRPLVGVDLAEPAVAANPAAATTKMSAKMLFITILLSRCPLPLSGLLKSMEPRRNSIYGCPFV